MAVARFRNLDQATAPTARPLDGRNLRSAVELSELCLRLHGVEPSVGVHRFASIQEARDDRLRCETEEPAS